jgi:hypothetical protein
MYHNKKPAAHFCVGGFFNDELHRMKGFERFEVKSYICHSQASQRPTLPRLKSKYHWRLRNFS